MLEMIAGPDPDKDVDMACRRPADPVDGVEEPTPDFYFGGDTPPMSVTDYIAWIAENDAHEYDWAEQERAARGSGGPAVSPEE